MEEEYSRVLEAHRPETSDAHNRIICRGIQKAIPNMESDSF